MQETPYGLLQPPLGSTRLTVIALLAALVGTGLPTAEEAVMSAGLVRLCLDLVLAYPFNSILHHQVYGPSRTACLWTAPWSVAEHF